MFDQISLEFHGTRQLVCSDCDNRLAAADGPAREELEREILASPDLLEGETVRANVDTGKACPACGAGLECRLRNFSIGSDGYGGLSSMGLPTYSVDLYACPRCGRVELYTAGAGLEKREEGPREVVCPECGTRHSPLINCPTCAAKNPWKYIPPDGGRGKGDPKPPWEK